MSSLSQRTVFVFTSCGLGQTENAELKIKLAKKFLALIADADPLPAQICFYTDGVKLVCEGSSALLGLGLLQGMGVRMVACRTCLEHFHLVDKIAVGEVRGMNDIVALLAGADSVVTV
jgi:hypothetical protein